ncbi:sensor domain-containing protein [Sporosarcina luteola]|uniref:sensor domain-containing protein n=1 Tax=Sporosarcina luteola TaxID=582850 RepID=UPI00203B1993|nr:EAL domain-containing protein [Sporosarcina luteola]MCM3710649.1 EAL domain-containing protein [Sporosarcina luteola]
MLFSELSYNSLVSLLDKKFCVSVTDRRGRITHVNDNFCELSGYSKEELLGKSYGIVNPGYTTERFVEEMEQYFSRDEAWQKNVMAIAKDGTPYWVNANIIPVLNADGEIIQFLSIDSDITARELTKGKYKETLQNLRNIENALDHSSVVAITDAKGVITYVNEKFCALSQYTSNELIGKTHRVVNSKVHPKSFFKEMWNTIQSGDIWQDDICNRAKDGSLYWVSTTIVPFLDDEGKPEQYIAIRHDITARKQAEESLEIALQNDFRTTVKNLQNAIFKYTTNEDREIEFTLFEGQIKERIGISVDILNTREVYHLFTEEQLVTFKNYLLAGMAGEIVQFELHYDGLYFLVYLSPIAKDGEIVEVVGTAIDITERIEAEKVIEHMAYFDSLTNLPNRRNLQERVKQKIAGASEGEQFAVLFLDLDRFKNVNDTLGHHVGDQLLIAVGERLRDCVHSENAVARLSGDEFVVLIDSGDTDELTALAAQIVEDISQPYYFEKQEIFVAPSIGIALYPHDGEDYSTLIRNADTAMYVAKEAGRRTFRFFTEELHEELMEKTFFEMELRQALEKGQFLLHYQPQFDLKTGQLIGMEALARWNHPERGFIPPLKFIEIAEENGFIIPLGDWVLKTACAQAKAWQEQGLPALRMSVNVSMRQFNQPSFVADALKILDETGLHPSYLNLEITESMMSDVKRCETVLQQLKDAGITVSVDDFGTGYSSLLYLSKFPLSHLKIDQAFIRELSNNNTAIVKAIIDLAKNLGLNVIAVGVETEEQEQFLKDLGCNEVQGYLYSKPLPLKEIEQLLFH